MVNLEDYINRLNNKDIPPPTPAETLSLLKEYPYFGLLAEAWLKRTHDEGMLFDMETRRQIARIAIISNPALGADYRFYINDLTGGYETEDELFPKTIEKQPETIEAIDIFLDKFAPRSDKVSEQETIEKLIFNPVADYATVLATEEQNSKPNPDEAPAGSNEELLNKFIITHGNNAGDDIERSLEASPQRPMPVPENKKMKKAEPRQQDVMLAESLAKMHILRKNYEAAYEILSKLNLNYPEKSIYFAVQLRFLKKLMLNKQLLSQQKASLPTN